MNLEKIKSIIAASRHFSALGEGPVGQIAKGSRAISLARDQLLFSRNDIPDAVYAVLSGEVAIEITSPNGGAVRVTSLTMGDVFGEFGVLDGGRRTADARALKPTQLLKIGKELYRKVVTDNPDFALSIITGLTQQLRSTDDQVENISLRPLKKRLAMLLLDLIEESPGAQPCIHITQTELAERLSATREKVNVHLQTIRKTGAISVGRGRIDFIDVGRLVTFAQQS